MTYLEKYKLEHPGLSDEQCQDVMINTCPHNEHGLAIYCPRDLSGIACFMANSQRCPICWNREIPGTEPTNNTTNEREDGNMSKKFTKKDLKVGYVVKYRNGEFAIVMPYTGGLLVFTDLEGKHGRENQYQSDLLVNPGLNHNFDVMEVYGFNKYCHRTMGLSSEYRELLWKREPEKTCDNCAHKVVCTHVGMCEHYMEKEASK